ncbi:MAG: FAD-binding oxidoreductase [Candidatus Thorarchaeota archaeon]
MLSNKQLQELADITGEDYFSAEDYMRSLYSHDIAALPGLVNEILMTLADAVAQPINEQVVSNLLKYCTEHKIPVVPRGHGTSGYGGALPTKGGLVIETTRLNEIHNIDRENMTVEVGSGVIWGNLIDILEDEGLAVGAYPSSAPSSTVGGWVAAGGTGIGSTKYGGIKEQVVDLEVVLPDGRIISTSSPPDDLVTEEGKSYNYFPGDDAYMWGSEDAVITDQDDVREFMVDSNGALGVITKVVLKVIPLRKIHPLVASFRSRDLMQGALEDILKATRPFYLHFKTRMFHRLLEEVGQTHDTTGEWIVLCTFEGTDDEIAVELEKLNHIVRRHNGTIEAEDIADFEWDERFYPLRIKRLGPSLAPSEVYVPLKRLSEFLIHMEEHFKRERYAVEGAVTDRGDVAVLTWFLDDERRKIAFLMGWYRSLDVIDIGMKYDGKAYSIGMWNVSHSRSFFGKDNYAKMAKLKKQTDPKGHMNPHKVFSGPLNLSLRFNILILLAVAVIWPIVLWIAPMLVPDIFNAYVPWLAVTDTVTALVAFGFGLVLGTVVVEIANMVPISFMLSIGGPFLRLGRRIWH